jgi:hypothetical protein
MNERPGEFSKIPKTALPALRDAIVDVYGISDLSEKVLEYDVDFATVVPAGVPFADQVLDLLRHFRKKNTLGSLLGALADGRPDYPEFRTRLVQVTRDAPVVEDGDDEDEEPTDTRRRWHAPLLAGAVTVAAVAAAFGAGRYLLPDVPDLPIGGELVIHLRQSESSILGGVYVKYDSVAKGPEQLAERKPSGEYHIARDDIAPRTGVYFEPDPAGAEGGQGIIRCQEDCYKILKVDFEDPSTLFLYLEEAR